MIRAIFKFFTGRSIQHKTDFLKLNALSPIIDVATSSSLNEEHTESYLEEKHITPAIVCREAILNKSQKVAGYSFTLTRSVNERVLKSSEIIRNLYDDLLLGYVLKMDIQRLLGHRLAFIPISPSSLNHPLIDRLPGERVVLVFSSLSELIDKNQQFHSKLVSLNNLGFRIGLQGNISLPGLQPFLDLAEFVFIDIGGNDIPTIKSQIALINNQNMNKNFVATNLRIFEEFHVCCKLPFDYFQGTFVTSREEWTTPAMDAGRIKILNLLNLLRQGAENSELVQHFKQDPALSFKILRYINSAGFGLASKVNSIEPALFLLGHQNIYRWLTLLLFTSRENNPLDLALMENALIRARFAELCGKHALSSYECNELFITGIFSLLDILLHMPMEKVLEQVNLTPTIIETLLHKKGQYAPYLQLAIACEESDHDLTVTLSKQIGLDLTQVNDYQIEALIWAEQTNH